MLIDNSNNLDFNRTRNLAEIVHDSAKRGFALLQNLLDWSRSQTGLIPFSPMKLSASDLINQCLADIEMAAKKKKIKILATIPDNIVLQVDKNMFCTVLRNLVYNSIKYSWENSSIYISVKCENGEAVIQVKDEGVGIPEENIKKLFRVDAGLTTPGTNREQGTGLGLLLCHEFVKKQKGRIWIHSLPGQGCSFYFTSPVTK